MAFTLTRAKESLVLVLVPWCQAAADHDFGLWPYPPFQGLKPGMQARRLALPNLSKKENLFHPVSTAVICQICRFGNALRTVGDGHWLTRLLLPGYLLPQPQRCGPSAVALPASSGQAVTMVMCQVVTSCDKLLCLCCP